MNGSLVKETLESGKPFTIIDSKTEAKNNSKSILGLLSKLSIAFWVILAIWWFLYAPYANKEAKKEHLENGNWLVCQHQGKEPVFIKPNVAQIGVHHVVGATGGNFSYDECYGVQKGLTMRQAQDRTVFKDKTVYVPKEVNLWN